MNEILKAIKERRSCRKYKPDMPPAELIDQICEAGSYAATGMNKQSPIIIAVTKKSLRDRLAVLNAEIMGRSDFDPFYGAPVVLIVLADKNIPTHVYDGSLVMGNLMLAAHTLGLSSCWIHRAREEFETDECKAILKELGIEGEYEGIGHCVVGYAEDAPKVNAFRKANYIYHIDD
ncbi:MAG: nitroreductase [Oscillospiraceae bacterium]|nr:nitroreductase [Oscillospiraceae bacterium]